MSSEKQRIDILLVERGAALTRELARRYIMAGEVSVNGQVIDKPGTRVPADAHITLRAAPRFVSRGGEKLAAALDTFKIAVEGAICADVGASTGGFTDCLLQRGAAKIYALDVGYGQLDYRLRTDERIVVMERTNARYVEALPERPTFVCVDASFISLRLLLPVIRGWLPARAGIVTLIKPQFEAGRQDVGKNGVVKDAAIHRRVVAEILSAAQGEGFAVRGLIPSPLIGPAGNKEFLAWLVWGEGESLDMAAAIAEAIPENTG
ncbi:MAG TPA: TlyA family RNA methyltransferase [Aggregatilineales bacterium]|nr:TlyA family RNA methyltransferase [Anaerolineales bacterium]HRE48683.1 TlyA family RNA methyltransferase [Aggregatilineales bacterium]